MFVADCWGMEENSGAGVCGTACWGREGTNESPAWQIALQRTISSLQVCALFLLHSSNVTNCILLCLSSDISVTLFGSQFLILSARADPNLNFLSEKTEMIQFLSPSRHFDEVSPMGTTDDSASYRILVTFGLIFWFFSFNFSIHFEEVNRIFFFCLNPMGTGTSFKTFHILMITNSSPSFLWQIACLITFITPTKSRLHRGTLNSIYSMNFTQILVNHFAIWLKTDFNWE